MTRDQEAFGVFVVRHGPEPAYLALDIFRSESNRDYCVLLEEAGRDFVVVSRGSCTYGMDEKVRYSFDLGSMTVSAGQEPFTRDRDLGSLRVGEKGLDVQAAGQVFRVLPHRILRQIDGRWIAVVEFPSPTRALVESLREPMDALEGYDSGLHAVVVDGRRIWFGLSFYDGEGLSGIGGVGFFDPSSGKAGLLRHPRLVGASVNSMSVSEKEIRLITEQDCEGSCDEGKELVIDRQTLEIAPAGPQGGSGQARLGWSEEVRAAIRREGADAFMIATFERERRMREAQFANTRLIYEKICTLTQESPRCYLDGSEHPFMVRFTAFNHTASGSGCAPPALFEVELNWRLGSEDGGPGGVDRVEVGAPGRSLWPANSSGNPRLAEEGMSFKIEDSGRRLEVELVDFPLVQVACKPTRGPDLSGPAMQSVKFRVRLWELEAAGSAPVAGRE